MRIPATAPWSRRGTILIAVVCALIMLSVVVIGVVYLGALGQDVTQMRVESARSLYAADAAANMAMQEFAANVDYDGDGTVGSVAGGSTSAGPTVNFAKLAASVSASGGVYTVTATGATTRSTHSHQLEVSRKATYPGLYTQCFALANAPGACTNVNWAATPGWATVMPNVDLPLVNGNVPCWVGGPTTKFAMRFQGYVTIPTAGTWTFYVNADDGALLYINGTLVVNNDGDHSPTTKSGTITLPAGAATFDLKYYENAGQTVIQTFWSGPGVASQTVIPASAFTCSSSSTLPALLGATSVTVSGSGGSYIDGFDARNGVYGGSNVLTSGFAVETNATTSGAISVTSATLKGNAMCGPGGTPGTAITTGPGGSITGTSTAATVGTAVMAVGVPSGMPSSTGDTTVSSSVAINSSYHVNNMTHTGGTITVSGNVVGEVDGNYAMSGSSSIVVTSGSTLTLYVSGTFSMSGTSTLNVSAGDPRAVRIYMIGSAKDMTLGGSAQCCAYARNQGGGLTVTGGSTPAPVYSGVFQGTTVSMTGNALLHADVSVGASNGASTATSLTKWMQVR